MLKPISNLPFDLLNLILEFDGKIKYIHKECRYVNIISKNDDRYKILEKEIDNKKKLINFLNIGNNKLNYYIDIYYRNDIFLKGLMFSKKMV